MKHEQRVVGHVSGWQEPMGTCVCGKPWPCAGEEVTSNEYPRLLTSTLEWYSNSSSADVSSMARELLAFRASAHETRPQCGERQDAYDAAAAAAVEKTNRDAARYRVVRVSKLISERIAPWDLDAACDEWIAKANAVCKAEKASVDVDAKLKELRERMMATDSTEKESAPQCEAIEQLFPALDGPKYRCRLPAGHEGDHKAEDSPLNGTVNAVTSGPHALTGKT